MLQRFLIPVRLPTISKFLPTLTVMVRDHRLYGTVKPVVATCSISLANKVPFLPDYVPPCTQPVLLGPEAEPGKPDQAIAAASPPLTSPLSAAKPADGVSVGSGVRARGGVGGVWQRAQVSAAVVAAGGGAIETSPDEVIVDMAGADEGPWQQPSAGAFDELPKYMRGRKVLWPSVSLLPPHSLTPAVVSTLGSSWRA
jgi:hypothetical protein